MTRKICIVTGARAEYGLLRGLIAEIAARPELALQLVVTGAHLSPEFGLTHREIEADGWPVAARVEMLLSSDTAVGVTKSVGLGIIGFADAFANLAPDIVVLLGDRYEILAAATAAALATVPVAHIHGGEVTEGAVDDSIRHAVSKLSLLHFVAAEPYRQRVIQLGEAPERVRLVGGLGVDAIARTPLMSRAELEADLGFALGARSLLITFHPVTLDAAGLEQLQAMLAALATLDPDVTLLFTMPNADTGGRSFTRAIERFVAERPNAHARTSLGLIRYLSLLAQVDGMVGNSSSGLLEAPSFGIGTVDIGDRQAGRLRADSVLTVPPESDVIAAAILRLFDPAFRTLARGARNPYGEPGASVKIADALTSVPLAEGARKRFYDLTGPSLQEDA